MTHHSASGENLRRHHPRPERGHEVARRYRHRRAARRPAAIVGLGLTVLLAGTVLFGCAAEDDLQETVPPPQNSVEDPPAGDARVTAEPQQQLEPPNPPSAGGEDTTTGPANAPTVPDDRNRPSGFELPPGEIPADSLRDEGAWPASGLQMPEENSAPPSGEASGDASGDSAASNGELDLQYASWQSVHEAATRGGQVTVVDLWALSCQPCLKEFPGLVRLNEQFGESARCIGFNVDFDGRKTRPPESYRDRIEQFLSAVAADFPNYISSTPSLEVFAEVGIDSIPAVLVFDQQGKLVEQFADTGETAGFTYEEDIIPLVAKLAG